MGGRVYILDEGRSRLTVTVFRARGEWGRSSLGMERDGQRVRAGDKGGRQGREETRLVARRQGRESSSWREIRASERVSVVLGVRKYQSEQARQGENERTSERANVCESVPSRVSEVGWLAGWRLAGRANAAIDESTADQRRREFAVALPLCHSLRTSRHAAISTQVHPVDSTPPSARPHQTKHQTC